MALAYLTLGERRFYTSSGTWPVMDDIDQKYGAAADGNYHRIADQAHYDLAHALGMTNVKLAAYH